MVQDGKELLYDFNIMVDLYVDEPIGVWYTIIRQAVQWRQGCDIQDKVLIKNA